MAEPLLSQIYGAAGMLGYTAAFTTVYIITTNGIDLPYQKENDDVQNMPRDQRHRFRDKS